MRTAATQMAVEHLHNLLSRGVFLVLQQSGGLHQDAAGAKAALHGLLFDERGL